MTLAGAFAPPPDTKAQDTKAPDTKAPVQAPPAVSDFGNAAKRADIRKLLVLVGSEAVAKQQIGQMIGMMKESLPQMPAQFWTELQKDLDIEALLAFSVDAYDRHMNHDDVKAMMAFFESPAGQRVSKAQPAIMQETSAAGMKWGQEVGEKAMRRVMEQQMQQQQQGGQTPPAR